MISLLLLSALLPAADPTPRLVDAVLTGTGGELRWTDDTGPRSCRVEATTHYDTLVRPFRLGDRVSIWLWEPEPGACRVLSVRLVEPAALAERPRTVALNLNPLDSLFQRGNMQYAGVVVRIAGDRLTVQTRSAGRIIFLLRPDTHYLHNGAGVPLNEVPVNQRVYVRAGTTFEGHIEAFRVAWGNILKPVETDSAPAPSAWGKP